MAIILTTIYMLVSGVTGDIIYLHGIELPTTHRAATLQQMKSLLRHVFRKKESMITQQLVGTNTPYSDDACYDAELVSMTRLTSDGSSFDYFVEIKLYACYIHYLH